MKIKVMMETIRLHGGNIIMTDIIFTLQFVTNPNGTNNSNVT